MSSPLSQAKCMVLILSPAKCLVPNKDLFGILGPYWVLVNFGGSAGEDLISLASDESQCVTLV